MWHLCQIQRVLTAVRCCSVNTQRWTAHVSECFNCVVRVRELNGFELFSRTFVQSHTQLHNRRANYRRDRVECDTRDETSSTHLYPRKEWSVWNKITNGLTGRWFVGNLKSLSALFFSVTTVKFSISGIKKLVKYCTVYRRYGNADSVLQAIYSNSDFVLLRQMLSLTHCQR